MEKQTNNALQIKIKDYQLFSILFSYKCLICSARIDKNSLKTHLLLCTSLKCINFDVSYEYNGNGQIQFVIDVYLDDQQWTIRKTMHNIRYFIKKMGIQQNQLFQKQKQINKLKQNQQQKIGQQDIGINQQRRLYLDQLFSQYRDNIWNSVFLIEYFGIDLNFLNCKHDKLKNGSMRGSKISLDLDSIQENIEPLGSNMLMKTGKFNKKTFNFGNM